jgi:hypothetical protein
MLKLSTVFGWMSIQKTRTQMPSMQIEEKHGWLGRSFVSMQNYQSPLQLAGVEARISFGRSQLNLGWSSGMWLQWHSRQPVKVWTSRRILKGRLMVVRYYAYPELLTGKPSEKLNSNVYPGLMN